MSRTILVGTDFSSEADKALRLGVEIARTLGAAVEIVHVHQPATYVLPPPLDIVALPDQGDDIVQIRVSLDERRKEAEAAGVAVSQVLLAGEPAGTLVSRAKELEPYLIVVGSRGSTGLAHILLGSVAERVVRHATCPVLVVPHRS